MLAADAMLRSSRFGFGIPGLRRMRRPGDARGVKLGLRPRSSTHEPSIRGGKMNSLRWMASCFGEPATKGKKVEAESVCVEEDRWDAATAAHKGGFPEHLVVMVNGLVGSAEDWKFAAEQFVKILPDKVIVHRSECNSSRLTFDGVDLMGERLAEEELVFGHPIYTLANSVVNCVKETEFHVISVVKRRRGIRKISFVAHSLGGLVARYAIGRLYEPTINMESSPKTEDREDGLSMMGRIAGLEPINFITFASPHLGSRGNKQLPFLCGLPFLERRASETAHLIVGRTGKHLFLTDNDDGKPPLLLRMVDDCDDIKFRSALRSFRRRVAYANANFDHMVGWRTSSIRHQRELPKHHHLLDDKKYPHIVYVDRGDNVTDHSEISTVSEALKDELEEEMIRGLTQVSWERVDVSFHKSRQRYVAHNTIQVKSYWLNSDGADVIFHMIDNFLT